MAKRKFILVMLLAMFLLPSLQMMADPIEVPLQVGYDDPLFGQDNPHKNPTTPPIVSIDGYTLYFVTPCDGCLLRIVDELDNVVYSTVIPTGATSLVLPSSLSGNYELQIVSGIYCFYGDITL